MKPLHPSLLLAAILAVSCGPSDEDADQSLRLPPEDPPPTRKSGPRPQPEPRPAAAPKPVDRDTFTQARAKYKETKLTRQQKTGLPTPEPPADKLTLVKFQSPLGPMDAYIGNDPTPDKDTRHPAVIWIVGGFENSIDENAWLPGPRDDDQSAVVFREAGIVTMYASLRGGNENPGHHEGLFGEVDDILAAADHLAGLDYVDPKRIYLGGHSVGGTLALLVGAADAGKFRAVFSFGPVAYIHAYPEEYLPFDVEDEDEAIMRSPIFWLGDLGSPTFVFEGVDGNIEHLEAMKKENLHPEVPPNPKLHFYAVEGGDHFSILRPISELLTEKILADTESDSDSVIEISAEEIAGSLAE